MKGRFQDVALATDADLKKLVGQRRMNENQVESVRGVFKVLGLKEKAVSFAIVLPKKLQDEMSKKELAYANRRIENIKETVFRVNKVGVNYEIIVIEQTPN